MNIYDIAQLAGVSIATVSRVVNDSPKVSEKTKVRVRRIMEENHYTPNVFARGLGLNSMKTVGLVCPDISDTYMAKSVSYLERNLKRYGYDCILCCSGYEAEEKRQAVERIMQKRIDVLILVSSNYAGGEEEDVSYIQEIAGQIPVFMINGYIEGENIYCILADDYQAVYDATQALLASGRTRILFVSDSNSYSARQKRKGYEDALTGQGLSVSEELILNTKNSIHYTRDLLLERKDLKFDSVVTTGDELAVGVLKFAAASGFRVPEDISVVGYDNFDVSMACEPELSTVDAQGQKLCSTAIDFMMALLKGEKIPNRTMCPCLFISRSTTDF